MWSSKLTEFIQRGTITHKEIESAIGRLSFAQTSVFGRVGQLMLTVLYQKVNAHFYDPKLSGRELSTHRWRSAALAHISPRLTRTRGATTDLIIYTDAATTTRIIAAVLLNPATFRNDKVIEAPLSLRVGEHWAKLFESTALIYGLEMLVIFAVLFDPLSDLYGQNVTFYVDNNNALQALVSNAPGPPEIAAATQLIWFRIAELNISAWFERAPSKKNTADLPTKHKPLPFTSGRAKNSQCLPRWSELIRTGMLSIKNGAPIDPPGKCAPLFKLI